MLCHEAKENIPGLNYCDVQTIELEETVSFDVSKLISLLFSFYLFFNMIMVSFVV